MAATGPTIAVFTKNRDNPAYAAARMGTERTAARFGGRVVHYIPDTPDSAIEQAALVDRMLREGADGVAFVATDAEAMLPAIRRINAAGIPLAVFVNRPLGGDVITFVGSDDVAIGRDVATYLARHLDGRGAIVVFEGTAGSMSNRDRMAGFGEGLAAFPGIRVAATLKGEFLTRPARAAMDDYLAGRPAFDAVLAANDAMAMGALEALEAAGIAVPVVGVNAVPDAIAAIAAGRMLATADFDAMAMASLATEALLRHRRGERVPATITLPVRIVDRGNCAAYARCFEERVTPRWEDVVPRPG